MSNPQFHIRDNERCIDYFPDIPLTAFFEGKIMRSHRSVLFWLGSRFVVFEPFSFTSLKMMVERSTQFSRLIGKRQIARVCVFR